MQSSRLAFICLPTAFWLLMPVALARCADSLAEIRREVRQPDCNDDRHRRDHHYHDHDHDDDDEGFFEGVLSGLLGGLLFGDDYDHHHHGRGSHHDHHHDRFDITYQSDEPTKHWQQPATIQIERPASYFAKFPYADGLEGYMMQQTWVPARPQTSSIQMLFHYGSDFDQIDRYTTSLLWETTSRWGIDSQWNYFTEKTAAGTTDDLHVGDVNVLMRILETRRLQSRVGAGLNWLSDAAGSDFGFNLTMRNEVYPLKPLIISSEIEWGTLGSTSQFHGAVGLGAAWRRVEFFSGYDYRKIGSTELAGPQFGLRVWY